MAKVEKIEKPWGYEKILQKGDRVVVKEMKINAGKRMSLQYHIKKEEIIVVLTGCLVVWDSDNDKNVKMYYPGESIHIKPGCIHRFGSIDQMDTLVIEASTPELEDVIRLADDFGRAP